MSICRTSPAYQKKIRRIPDLTSSSRACLKGLTWLRTMIILMQFCLAFQLSLACLTFHLIRLDLAQNPVLLRAQAKTGDWTNEKCPQVQRIQSDPGILVAQSIICFLFFVLVQTRTDGCTDINTLSTKLMTNQVDWTLWIKT